MSGRLSVALVARDAARTLDRVLASVAWADDVVLLLDPRTRDATESIARAHGARVIAREWTGFVSQKNAALAAVAHDWVLCLDADEAVSPDLAREVRALRDAGWPRDVHGFSVPRRSFYLGRWIRHGGWWPDRKVRLVRRDAARWGGVDPHDRLDVEGAVEQLQGALLHYTYADTADHRARALLYSTTAADALHAAGRRASAWDVLVRPAWHFVRTYVLQAGVLDGRAGWAIATIGAAGVHAKYARLRALGRDPVR